MGKLKQLIPKHADITNFIMKDTQFLGYLNFHVFKMKYCDQELINTYQHSSEQ